MGRWAESHDQRKGQWLYNKLRPSGLNTHPMDIKVYKSIIADRLWNMTNEEFDKFMEDYFK